MRRSQEGRVEELSKKVGGRFTLTGLIQKQAREYYMGGRAFMPSVRNLDELFNYILTEIEDGKIGLMLREAPEEEDATDEQEDGQEGGQEDEQEDEEEDEQEDQQE